MAPAVYTSMYLHIYKYTHFHFLKGAAWQTFLARVTTISHCSCIKTVLLQVYVNMQLEWLPQRKEGIITQEHRPCTHWLGANPGSIDH